jgi:magnesium transporter
MHKNEVQFETFKWVDLLDPDQATLATFAKELIFPEKVMLNCLDSDYLPHVETYGDRHFLILRLMEPKTKMTADSVQELTTKIALFLTPDTIVSVHRLKLIEIENVKELTKDKDLSKHKLLSLFFEQVARGFDEPLTDLEHSMQTIEEKMFAKRKSKSFLQEGFYLKRKSLAFKKVLKLTLDLMSKLIMKAECSIELFQVSRDRLERSLFYAEDVHENVQSLLSLHLSIESQKTNDASFRTNEIMRVLTVLTIFFLPLNFIAGVFGMNFREMPLVGHSVGFWGSLLLMSGVSLALGIYLYRQGWLDKPEIKS